LSSREKLYYRMGEACKRTDLEPHVLRYWESEFEQLKPRKNRAGHRVFTDQDLQTIKRIKRYVHDEGYTIAGAKKKLEEDGSSAKNGDAGMDKARLSEALGEIREELQNVLNMLDADS